MKNKLSALFLCPLIFPACSDVNVRPALPDQSKMAVISIEHPDITFDEVRLTITEKPSEAKTEMLFQPGMRISSKSLTPGDYHLRLEYSMGGLVAYSSGFCDENKSQSENQHLIAGLNKVELNICNRSEQVAKQPSAEKKPVADQPNYQPSVGDKTKVDGVLYINPSPAVDQAIKNLEASRPEDAKRLRFINAQPTATWLGEWSGDVELTVRNLMQNAGDKYVTLVAYNIPDRDCGQHSEGGLSDGDLYRAWITKISKGIGNGRAIVILEPDALPLMTCLDQQGKDKRFELLQSAVNILKKNPQNRVYLDVGHGRWLGAEDAVERLVRGGIAFADGFAINSSNYQATDESIDYGQRLSKMLGGKPFVIDTSRNGNGPSSDNAWCNPRGRALGITPSLDTKVDNLDAYLWIKRPGESDGNCNGGPSAGELWLELALELAVNAGK